MKCFYCHKEIDEGRPHEITAPDGDVFHTHCLTEHNKERDAFFDEVIQDDEKFHRWWDGEN